MQILVTGGTGFIGQALLPALRKDGHELLVLSRSPRESEPGITYLRELDEIHADACIDAIVNLAGASLAGRRWNRAYKKEIVASRIDITAALARLCGRMQTPPAVLLSGSAVGYYGARDATPLEESAAPGEGFAAELCVAWEREALVAAGAGLRVCRLRLGVVLDRDGGALQKIASPFRLGVANWIGGGRQWMSWIHRDDVVAAIRFLLYREDLAGAFNITAPTPLTSRELCSALKRQLRTVITIPMPAIVMRLLVGEMADELLISGQRVVPAALLAAGFEFRYPSIDTALLASL